MKNHKILKTLLSISIILIFILILFFPQSALAQTCDSLEACVKSGPIIQAWKWVLGILNVGVVLGLIIIAFANILRLNIELYHIKRMLPAIIIGVIFANFSLLISRVFVDFAQLLAHFFLEGGSQEWPKVTAENIVKIFGFPFFSADPSPNLVAGLLVYFGINPGGLIIMVILGAIILIGIPGLLIFIIALLLAVRNYVIWALVILSPIAFFCLFFTPGQKFWQTWWSWFLKWLFMAPIAFFFLRIAVIISDANILGDVPEIKGVDFQTSMAGQPGLPLFGRWFFGIVLFCLAIYVPWQLGGSIMSAWGNLWKRAGLLGAKGLNQARLGMGSRFMRSERPAVKGLGKLMLTSPGLIWETRQKAFQKEQFRATMGGPFAGLTRRADIEQIISATQTLENMDMSEAYGFVKGGTKDSKIQKFLLAAKKSGRGLGYLSNDEDEMQGKAALTKMRSEAMRGTRGALSTIYSEYDLAGIDLNAGNMRSEREFLSRAGRFVEGVEGEGLPQVPGSPRNAAQMAQRLLAQLGGTLPETEEFAQKNANMVKNFMKSIADDEVRALADTLEESPIHARIFNNHLEAALAIAQSEGDTTTVTKINALGPERVNSRVEKILPYTTTLKEQIQVNPATAGEITAALRRAESMGRISAPEDIEVVKRITGKAEVDFSDLKNINTAMEAITGAPQASPKEIETTIRQKIEREFKIGEAKIEGITPSAAPGVGRPPERPPTPTASPSGGGGGGPTSSANPPKTVGSTTRTEGGERLTTYDIGALNKAIENAARAGNSAEVSRLTKIRDEAARGQIRREK